MKATLKDYYILTKPGIIYGNDVAAVAGFAFAAIRLGSFSLERYLAMLIGVSLVIASGCVFNNYLDRGIDKHMTRTKKRPLVTGTISGRAALVYAAALCLAGFGTLALWTNTVTVVIGLVGIIDYVILYAYSKRKSPVGTIVGSVSGAMPPAAGYTAMTGHFDVAALLLFLIWVFWQMPHFYGIALFRTKDYAAAKVPVLPVKKGARVTRTTTMAYIVAYTVSLALMTAFGYTGYIYLVVMVLFGAYWFWKGIKDWPLPDEKWGKNTFLLSLVAMLVMCVGIPLGALLP